ncbi:zinc finger BED domain-containing protein 5-like [Octopus sinensis]|uniref:Zinc finger BED domain-containing protein 5-like n=1 Tax=Octopus sinensis TaxID=2607531 RepID=A0A6P7T795_9MOLL|nr:zinc finger BED domain-containing protein 5-like [Octopus sinensis]
MSSDIDKNLCSNKLKYSPFASQVNESTDIINKAQLLAFIRFIDEEHIRGLDGKKETLREELKEVLNKVVQMVNFIETRPVKSRIFEQLCTDMDSQHKRLLLHTEVRWMSRGKILTRVHELRHELLVFFEEMKQSNFCDLFRSEVWISRLQFLADIFQQLNILNTSMQGKKENIVMSTDKMKAFERKIKIWKR